MAHLRMFDVVFTEKYSIQEKLIYLETCDNLGTFVGEDVKNVVNVTKKIKELLTSSLSRVEGLALLHTVLSQCSTEVFTVEAVAWLQLCTKIIQSNEGPDVKKLCSSVLCQLLRYVSSYSHLCQKVPASIITPVVETILKISIEDEWKIEALNLLVACMTFFPGPCGNSKIEIEKFVLKNVYNWSESSIEVISQCVAMIPLTGGSGNLGLSHSGSWFEQCSSILSSMNQLVEYFADQSKLDEFETMVLSSVDIPNLPSSDPLKALFYASRLYQFLGSCLCKMLSTNVPVNVKVPVNAILSHICQSLAMRTPLREQINLDSIAVSSLLPSLHIVSLDLLESMILCCGDILVPNASLISNVLLQTLEYSTDEDESENSNTSYFYSNLRKKVYIVLQTLVRKLGSNSLVYESISLFYPQIYLDIKTKVDDIKLIKRPKFDDTSSRSSAKKKRRMVIDSSLNEVSSEDSHKFKNPDCDWVTVKESLAALKTILYASGPLIKDDVHRKIGKTIITLLLKVQQNPDNIQFPYSNPLCRRELYRVLLALIVCPNSSCPPPYQPAVRIFSVGQRDNVGLVAEYCAEALTVSGSLSHPIVAPLQFCSPVEVQESYASEADESASNEVESDYQDERDSIMEEEDDEFAEEYPAHDSSMEDVEEMTKKPQSKPLGAMKPSLTIPQKPQPIAQQPQHQLPQQTPRGEIVLVDEEGEPKNIAVRSRINTPLRPTALEERKPTHSSVHQQLQRKLAQPPGVIPLAEPSRNAQPPRPKSLQNNLSNSKVTRSDQEVLDVSEDVVEMDEEDSEEAEEEYEEDEEDGGRYGRGGGSEDYDSAEDEYEHDELANDREEEDEDERAEFMKSVYEGNIYSGAGDSKQGISRKGQIPIIQKSIPNSNNAVTTINISNLNQQQQRTAIKTSSGIMRMEECVVGDAKEKTSLEINPPVTPINSSPKRVEFNSQGLISKRGPPSPVKNEVFIPKTNDFIVTVINEPNHVIIPESLSPTSRKDPLDITPIDISISPVKDRLQLAQQEPSSPPQIDTEAKPILIHSIEGNAAAFALEEEMEKEALTENNISLAVKSIISPEELGDTSPTSTHPEIEIALNQKSPHHEETEVTDYSYGEVEECVEELVDDEDKQSLEEVVEPEAKKICIAIEEKDVDSMLKDFKPCLKDD